MLNQIISCYCKLITIALIIATSVYFQVVDVVVNEKLTHVIDEIDTIENKANRHKLHAPSNQRQTDRPTERPTDRQSGL